jgi:hypothetical protein
MKKMLALLALVLAPAASFASIVTYDFTVTATDGSLRDNTSTGYFSYDDAFVTANSHYNIGPGHDNWLTDLYFKWDGRLYTLANADSGFMVTNGDDQPLDWSFGSDCLPFSCSVSPGAQGWWVLGVPDSPGFFAYAQHGRDFGNGTVTSTLRITTTPVDEPGSLITLGMGLLLIAAVRRLRMHR